MARGNHRRENNRRMQKNALNEMIIAYRQQKKEIPLGGGILEQLPVEVEDVS